MCRARWASQCTDLILACKVPCKDALCGLPKTPAACHCLVFLPFEIPSSEEAFLLSSQLYRNVSSMTSPSSKALGCGGKGTACEAVRGTAQFAEMHASQPARFLLSQCEPQHGWPWTLPCAALWHLCCHHRAKQSHLGVAW